MSPIENHAETENTMTESDLRTQATEIHEQFSDQLELTVDEVESRLETLVNEYKVPTNEARRSVVNTYLDEAGMERDDLGGGGNEKVDIAEIDSPEEWVDVTAKVGFGFVLLRSRAILGDTEAPEPSAGADAQAAD